MNDKALRIVSILTFVPAFPMCVVHGVLSYSIVPAIGLIPLASSAALGVFLLVRQRRRRATTGPSSETGPPERPILIFLADTIHAAGLMVVLVFTWMWATGRGDRGVAMLAAYATIPLLINFFIHLYFAVSALYTGLAVHDLMLWLAWQAVPPECPNCNERLRPSLPEIPWFQRVSLRRAGATPRWKMKMPAMPAIKAPEWTTPGWLRRPGAAGYRPLFAAADEESHYHDEPEDVGEPSTAENHECPAPATEEAVVVSKGKI